MAGRRRRVDGIPAEQSAAVGANIKALRLRNGWTQAKLGELMGWPTNATVCAAEGHRAGRQRGFSGEEVKRLADIFGVSPAELTTLRELRRASATLTSASVFPGQELYRAAGTVRRDMVRRRSSRD